MARLRSSSSARAEDHPIRVVRFFDEHSYVGIEDVPQHLDDPHDNETTEEAAERISGRNQWVESGRFVFWWATDYYMSKHGDVEST